VKETTDQVHPRTNPTSGLLILAITLSILMITLSHIDHLLASTDSWDFGTPGTTS